MATLLRFSGLKFVGVLQTKLLHSFSSNFRVCLPQEDLELIRFSGYPLTTVAMATLLRFSGLKHCGCSCTDFHPIFRVYLPHEDLELIRFWGVSSNICCHGNTFFEVLNFVGVPQSKPMHGFSPNLFTTGYQDMFTTRGSRAY